MRRWRDLCDDDDAGALNNPYNDDVPEIAIGNGRFSNLNLANLAPEVIEPRFIEPRPGATARCATAP